MFFKKVKAIISEAPPVDKPQLESLFIPLFLLLKNKRRQVLDYSLLSRLKLNLASLYFKLQQKFTEGCIPIASVCFYADTSGQMLQQLPVLKALEQAGVPCVFLVHKSTLYKKLREERVETIFIPINYLRLRQPLSSEWIKGATSAGLSSDQIKQVEEIALAHYYLPQLKAYAEKWIKKQRPRAFVPGHDLNPACRAITLAFRENGVPCFCIQHGSIGNDSQMARAHIVQHFLAFGEITQQNLQKTQVPFKVHIPGPPYLKTALETARKNYQANRALMPGNAFENMVLVAFSGAGHGTSESHLQRQIAAVSRLAEKYRQTGFLFKLHPKDSKENYKAVTPFHNCFVVHDQDFVQPPAIFNWLERCTALISGASAVIMEALLVEKPIFTLDFMKEYQDLNFIRAAITIHSESEHEFWQNFEEWHRQPALFAPVFEQGQRFIRQYFAHPEDAAERCASIVMEESGIFENSNLQETPHQ